MPPRDDSRRAMTLVLLVGGFVVLGLLAAGAMVWSRQTSASSVTPRAASAPALPTPNTAPIRIEPSTLLANARREASAWSRDAVLVSLSAGPLDARGVIVGGKVEIIYAKPSGRRIVGGAETTGERLALSSSDGRLTKTEERAGKARLAPEPNCGFEDAWAAARRAGADSDARLSLRYIWSDRQARPVWEVLTSEGGALRRLDGVSCSILTR